MATPCEGAWEMSEEFYAPGQPSEELVGSSQFLAILRLLKLQRHLGRDPEIERARSYLPRPSFQIVITHACKSAIRPFSKPVPKVTVKGPRSGIGNT